MADSERAGHFGLSDKPDFGNVSSNSENGSWLACGYNVDREAALIFKVAAVAADDVPFVSRFKARMLLAEAIFTIPVGDDIIVGS